MQVKAGYKQTEVGVIPKDWEVHSLGDIGESLIGLTYCPADVRADGILVLRSSNIQDDKLRFDDNVFVSTAIPDRIMVRDGDILICVRNGSRELIGKSVRLDERARGMTFGAFMAVFRTPYSAIASHQFQSGVIKRQIHGHLGATINQITNKSLNSFRIPLPPTKAEQEAIAETLSDVDDLIESLEQLIAKKRQLKQGAMQELLTGKKRLPGFSGKWEVKRLGEVFSISAGKSKSAYVVAGGRYWVVDMGSVSTDGRLIVSKATNYSGDFLSVSDLVMPKDDIGGGGIIGKVGYIDADETYVMGDHVYRLTANLGNPLFLSYVINAYRTNTALRKKVIGSAQLGLGRKSVDEQEMPFPPHDEQNAIASVLSDMDAEIAALETKLAKARQVKQGMMQELLTGRIRLVAVASKIISLPVKRELSTAPTKSHNWQINEAVIIAVLAKHFGTAKYPLARKRCTKLTYLLHRWIERTAEGYLKKAAGPYNPAIRYKGPETIAQKNGYILLHHNGAYEGFTAAENILEAETYFGKWYRQDVLKWLEQFRFKKTDELELLTTVDMAIEDLWREGQKIELDTVKQVIWNHPEWKAKLNREIFSDGNIIRAIQSCKQLFAKWSSEK